MKKNYIALALLLAASSLTGMAAKTLADFDTAKADALAKMTSWSSASPFAPDAFSKGLADLGNAEFVAFPDGDAAVQAIDDIVSATLSSARVEITVKMPTVFVTMTTDALTANPVDGGHLVGTPYENRLYNDAFKTYSKACQGSAWLIFEQSLRPGKYAMRNNVVQYISSKKDIDTDDYLLSASYNSTMQPDIDVDFADNGKMVIKSGDFYIGTDETGGLAYFDALSPSTSWTFARAYEDKKCDLPRLSTAEDPIWYVIRSAAAPDDGYLTSRYPDYRSLVLGPLRESTMWRFEHNTVIDNDWANVCNKNGSMLLATQSGHAECNLESAGYPYTAFAVIDGYEEYGLLMFVNNQERFQNFDNPWSYDSGRGCPFLLTKAPGTFSNQYTIDLSWMREEFPPASSFWLIEESNDASLMDFLNKRSQYAAEVNAYAASQPWAHDAISAAVKSIQAVEYTDYPTVDEANAAIRSIADKFLAGLPAMMLAEASSEESYFSLNNARRMGSRAEAGWMISADAEGNLSSVASDVADKGSTWQAEKATDTTFRLRNREGFYIGSIRSGQDTKTTVDASAAATFSFLLSGGRIVLKSTRSSLNMDDAEGVLTAGADNDPGSLWILKKVVVLPEGDIVTSDISNQWLYTITSVSDPLVYLESEGHRYYCYARGYLSEQSYWFLEDITTEDGGYRFVSSILASQGIRMCRNPLGDNYFGGPVCYDSSIPTSDFAIEHWYIIPVEYDGKRAYQITTCYPPKGDCCLSREMVNGVMTYSSTDDLENTAWYFNHVEGIDHEGMFNDKRYTCLAQLDAFLRVQPFVQDHLQSARDYVATATMNDFGPDYYSSYSALMNYVNNAIERAKWLLEVEPRGCTVRFSNVRRAENGAPSYLAAVDGRVNTVDITDEAVNAADWVLEYYANGCYRLRNAANGEYLGKLSSAIETVADVKDAGLYLIDFRNYFMTLADRNNPELAINVDQSGSDACVYDANDSGSRWTIELVKLSGVETVTSGDECDNVEYYDLKGLRVSPEGLAPGIYIRRCGDSVSKILVR